MRGARHSCGVTAPSILFVCLGNICRSPMAEGAMRAEMVRRGLEWEVDSAGTADYHIGKPPDPRAIACAAWHGVDISYLRSRQVGAADFRRFTHIFALDKANLANLRDLKPADAPAKLGLLLGGFVPNSGEQAVADPYYGDAAIFETTWAIVSTAAAAICDRLGD